MHASSTRPAIRFSSTIAPKMSLARRLFFNLFYFSNPPWDTGISPPELLTYLASHPAGRALDLGCGTGTNVITLARQGWQVTGVDFARRAIQIARRKARQAGVSIDLRVGDVTRLEGVSGPFDLILDIGCFHGLDPAEMQVYISNLDRLLASQGTFLMYGFFREEASSGPGMLPSDLNRFSPVFDLVRREDSTDRQQRASVWLTYCRRLVPEP